jgi:hypothetical protein
MRRTFAIALFCAAGVSTGPAQGTLPTPTDVQARFSSMTPPHVELSWRAPFGPWFFSVYRSVGDTLAFQQIGISGNPRFLDFAILPQTTYYYRVAAAAYQDGQLIEGPRSSAASIFTGGFQGGPRGTVAGIVTADAGGGPIPQVRVRFYRVGRNSNPVTTALTGPSGQYTALIDTGVYILKAEPSWEGGGQPGFRSEWFNNVPEPSLATPVAVTPGSSFTANFGLAGSAPVPRVNLAGLVTAENGSPIANATVVALRSLQEMNSIAATTGTTPGLGPEAGVIPGLGYTRGILWKGTTGPTGQFVAQVPAGRPFILMAVRQGYRPEFAVEQPDPTRADVLVVRADTAGIRFTLDPLPTTPNVIQGVIRDSLGAPVPSRVILFPRPIGTQSSPIRLTHTDTTGAFRAENLASGSYIIQAVPFSGFAPAYYRAGEFGVANWQRADSIPASGVVSGVTVGLLPVESDGLTRVSGSLRNGGNLPVGGGSLIAYASPGVVRGYGITEADGSYSIDALVTGPVSLVVTRSGYTVAQGTVIIPPDTYTVSGVDFSIGPAGATSVADAPELPAATGLRQNYPNPFNPATVIQFSIRKTRGDDAKGGGERVRLAVYDLLGREVAVLVAGTVEPGEHQVTFDGSSLASGVYLYRLEAGGIVDTKRMLLLR